MNIYNMLSCMHCGKPQGSSLYPTIHVYMQLICKRYNNANKESSIILQHRAKQSCEGCGGGKESEAFNCDNRDFRFISHLFLEVSDDICNIYYCWGICNSSGRVGRLPIGGLIPDSSRSAVEVSLGRTLNLTLILKAVPSVCECVCERVPDGWHCGEKPPATRV